MDLILENFHILLMIGIAFAAWLKNRGSNAEDEEAERQAREEMIRHLREVEERPVQRAAPPKPPTPPRASPPPVPQQWSTAPQSAPPPPPRQTPPKLKDIFQELVETIEPSLAPEPQPQGAYAPEDAPWDYEHQDASHSEITDASDPNEPTLNRQRQMQERLAELKAQASEYKGQAAGARETQRRASGKSKRSIELRKREVTQIQSR